MACMSSSAQPSITAASPLAHPRPRQNPLYGNAKRGRAPSYGARSAVSPTPIKHLSASSYDPAEDVALQPYGYTGRRYDDETQLWYFRARYFDAELGRFISRDPLGSGSPRGGYQDGMSLYRGYFAPNFVDPYGLLVVNNHVNDRLHESLQLTEEQQKCLEEAVARLEGWLAPPVEDDAEDDTSNQKLRAHIIKLGGNPDEMSQRGQGGIGVWSRGLKTSIYGVFKPSTPNRISVNSYWLDICTKCPLEAGLTRDEMIEVLARTLAHEVAHLLDDRRPDEEQGDGKPDPDRGEGATRELGFELEMDVWGEVINIPTTGDNAFTITTTVR